jgi:hypothetical protein
MAHRRLGSPDLFGGGCDAPGLHEHLEDHEEIEIDTM